MRRRGPLDGAKPRSPTAQPSLHPRPCPTTKQHDCLFPIARSAYETWDRALLLLVRLCRRLRLLSRGAAVSSGPLLLSGPATRLCSWPATATCRASSHAPVLLPASAGPYRTHRDHAQHKSVRLSRRCMTTVKRPWRSCKRMQGEHDAPDITPAAHTASTCMGTRINPRACSLRDYRSPREGRHKGTHKGRLFWTNSKVSVNVVPALLKYGMILPVPARSFFEKTFFF